jgi:hypothetical protein
MKRLSLVLSCMLFFSAPMIFAQDGSKTVQQASTLQDYDTQIAQLKQDIARYNGMASMYGQQAQLVEFQDFEGYRDAATLRDRCLAVVKELNDHLAILEQQRAVLANRTAAPEKK